MVCLLLLGATSSAWSASTGEFAEYRTDGGALTLELRADYLGDFGLAVEDGDRVTDGRFVLRENISGGISARLSSARFDRFVGGRIRIHSSLALRYGTSRVRLDELALLPGPDLLRPTLQAFSPDGEALLALTHLHTNLSANARELLIGHADIVATPALARRLGFEALTGQVLGSAELRLDVADFEALVEPSVARGEAQCEGRPFWPQDGHRVDSALTDIGGVQYQGRDTESSRIKLAPSAWLKNAGPADVPWIARFEENAVYPYAPNDQHPYLVWSLYRMHEGRIEQLAVSGAKHAFNTVNLNCDLVCDYFEVNSNNGDVLGPGCEDVYGASTNDMNAALGPRSEIEASLGAFTSTGSFFDQDADGVQDKVSGDFEHRLLVDETELSTDGARYFVDAWYLVQCDSDIWNSMGSVEVAPTVEGDGWRFPLVDAFSEGVAIDRWVAEGSGQPFVSDHAVVSVPSETPGAGCPGGMPQGHLRVLVRVESSGGQYRYIYAVQNHDLDRGMSALEIPLADGAQVSPGPDFSGPADADWSGTVVGDKIVFEDGPGETVLEWATLHTIEFTTDASPARGEISLNLAGAAQPQSVSVATIVPGNDLLFFDRFRQADP